MLDKQRRRLGRRTGLIADMFGDPLQLQRARPVAGRRAGKGLERVEDANRITGGPALQTDRDYTRMLDGLLKGRRRGDPVYIFAYGSLLWKPAFAAVDEQRGLLHGWHRSFCFWVDMYRGTPARPGLMLSLDRGGCCKGMLLKVSTRTLKRDLMDLLRREVVLKPSSNVPRWVSVHTATGVAQAIAFVADRRSPRYAGRLPARDVAQVLAVSQGPRGSMAEYLRNTVDALACRGIHDRNLARLQALLDSSRRQENRVVAHERLLAAPSSGCRVVTARFSSQGTSS